MVVRLLTIILLFLPVAIQAGQFGCDSSNGASGINMSNRLYGQIDTCLSTGALDSLFAYVRIDASNYGGVNLDVRASIYKASDSSLVDSTTHRTMQSQESGRWIGFGFEGNDTVYADTGYVICINSENDFQFKFIEVYRRSNTGKEYWYDASFATASAWPNPMTGHTHSEDYEYCMYVTHSGDDVPPVASTRDTLVDTVSRSADDCVLTDSVINLTAAAGYFSKSGGGTRYDSGFRYEFNKSHQGDSVYEFFHITTTNSTFGDDTAMVIVGVEQVDSAASFSTAANFYARSMSTVMDTIMLDSCIAAAADTVYLDAAMAQELLDRSGWDGVVSIIFRNGYFGSEAQYRKFLCYDYVTDVCGRCVLIVGDKAAAAEGIGVHLWLCGPGGVRVINSRVGPGRRNGP